MSFIKNYLIHDSDLYKLLSFYLRAMRLYTPLCRPVGVLGGPGGSRWLAGIFQRQGCIVATVMVF